MEARPQDHKDCCREGNDRGGINLLACDRMLRNSGKAEVPESNSLYIVVWNHKTGCRIWLPDLYDLRTLEFEFRIYFRKRRSHRSQS
jgi:hypothetical protein